MDPSQRRCTFQSRAPLAGFSAGGGWVIVPPQGGLALDVGQIDPTAWYPYSMLTDTLHTVENTFSASGNIFFRAGINFLRIWYHEGPGRTLIHSGLDWLYANQVSGGYNTVARGGSKDEIGWCNLQSIDEQARRYRMRNFT